MNVKRCLVVASLLITLVVAGCARGAVMSNEADLGRDERNGLVELEVPLYAGEGLAPAVAVEDMPEEEARAGYQAEPAQTQAQAFGRSIISQAQMTVWDQDPELTLIQIEDLALTLGGFTSNSQLSRVDDQIRGLISIRVPADAFKDARRRIREMAQEVVSDDVSGQDVTEEFTDLQSRLRNLEATEAELLELLTTVRERTQSAAEVLTIFNELTKIRDQIEQVQGRINYLDDLVSFATITVQVLLPPEPQKVALSGEVESVEGETFVVNETTVTLDEGAEVIGEIEAGAFVEVKGLRLRDGTVSASRVQVAESLSGEVESIENRTLIVDGTTVLLGPETEVTGTLKEGSQVEVQGFYEEDGSVRAVRVKVTVPAPSWDPERTIRRALERLSVAARGVADAAIWVVVYVLPIALMLGAPALAAFGGWRWYRRRRAGRVEAQATGED